MAATKLRIYQDALRLLADARLSVITDDVASRYALDDAWDEAVEFVLRQAAWRFAMTTVALAAGGSAVAGYSFAFAYPAPWLRTQAMYTVGADGREYPVDLREANRTVSANVAALIMRYVSSVYADPALAGHPWPEHFAQTVAAYLAFLVAERVTGERGAAGRMAQLFNQLLGEAVIVDAEPADRWLPHQRSGAMLRRARELLGEGFWRFAMETVAPVAAGTPVAGFSTAYQIPADHISTHAMFWPVDGLEAPVDFREQGATWSTNITSLRVRYVSVTRGLNATLWPEPFRAALLAALEDGPPADGEQQRPAASPYQAALAAALAAESAAPNRWLPFQLSGEMQIGVLDLLRRGFWRFAMVNAAISVQSGTPESGFAYAFEQPDDWLASHRLSLPGVSPECPFEIRESGGLWSTNVLQFRARYVSSLGTDSRIWPEPFRDALLDRLESAGGGAEAKATAQSTLAAAMVALADEPDGWLRHQLSGAYGDAARLVMRQGYWVYRDANGAMRGLKERQYSSLDDQSANQPSYPFPYRYPLPDDWFTTHALFVPWDGHEAPINIRETSQDWSADAESFVARYVATDVLDSTAWPDPIARAVLAYLDWQAAPAAQTQVLEASYRRQLADALTQYSRPADDFLRFQLDGSFDAGRKELLESGRWRFAVKTASLTESSDPLPSEEADGTVSDSYAYRFISPNDLLRTVNVYVVEGAGPYARRCDIDYRDEQGAIHANYTPITVRYVSRMGLDGTKWTAHFRDALIAWLQYREARGDPAQTAIAQAKWAAYEQACGEARRLDEARDRPAVTRYSSFTAARRGYGPYAYDRGPLPR